VYGEIRSIKMAPKQSCSFVTFVKREEAEEAAAKLYKILKIKDTKVNLMWGRPKASTPGDAPAGMSGEASSSAAAASSSTQRPYYPSMDPEAMGNAPLEGEMPDQRTTFRV